MEALIQFIAMCAVSFPANDDGTYRFPIGELDEPCEWPFDPLLLVGQPIGMYHCPYCGSMVLAGLPHPDWNLAAMEAMDEMEEQLRDAGYPPDLSFP